MATWGDTTTIGFGRNVTNATNVNYTITGYSGASGTDTVYYNQQLQASQVICDPRYVRKEYIKYNDDPVKKDVYANFPFKKKKHVALLTQLQGDFDSWTSGIRKEIFA